MPRRNYPPKTTAIATGRITRERSCDGKKMFRTPEYAEKMARFAAAVYGHAMTYYFCPFCEGYHLATDKREAAE